MTRLWPALLVAAALWGAPPLASAQKYRFPISNAHVSKTYVTAYFDHSGKDWSCGTKRYGGHRGSDYGCGSWSGMSAGRDIVAAAAGKVVYTHDGENDKCSSGSCGGGGGYGNYVKLQHADGKVTYYAHMKKGSLKVKTGQTVTCGQKLGQIGSSGNSTGPHLHFEVRSGSSRRDPFKGSCGGYGYWVSQGSYKGHPSTKCDGPTGPVCGNGKCESGESNSSCPKDCKPELDAKFAGQGSDALKGSGGAYYSLCPGQTFKFWFSLTNTGTLTWEDKGKSGVKGQAVKLGHKKGATFGVASKVSLNTASDTSVGPGQTTKFTLAGKAPSTTGVLKTEWQLLSDGVGWFGPIMFLTFNVTATPPGAGGSCDTGKKGVCKAGTKKCVAGKLACVGLTESSTERCGDGKDNDCDGQVDEPGCLKQGVDGGKQPPDAGTPGDGYVPGGDLPPGVDVGPQRSRLTLSGGCGCGMGAGGAGAPAVVVLLLLAMLGAGRKLSKPLLVGFAILAVIIWTVSSATTLYSDGEEVLAEEGAGAARPLDARIVENRKSDPVQTVDEYRLRQAAADFSEQWYGMIRSDISEINDVARRTLVPGEAILGAIFVEDIRFFTPDWSSAISYSFFKARLRRVLPNDVLTRLGHNPNPPFNRSFYGIVWKSTFAQALQYLSSLQDLNPGTKQLITKRTIVVEYWTGDDKSSLKTKPSYNFSAIERIAIVLKAHIEYWNRNGHDILSYRFDGITTFGERIGVLITLNNIFSFRPQKEGDRKQKPGGCSPCFGNAKRDVIPHRDPRLGGTNLWGWTNYGNVVRVFVDMKIARSILELKDLPGGRAGATTTF